MAVSPALLANDDATEGLAPAPETPPQSARASCGEIISWCLTGMSGWWSLNVITAELPYFVATLPEQEALGNLIAVCTQVGNILPIAYKTAFRQRAAGQVPKIIAGLQILGVATLTLCGMFWKVGAGKHSIALLLCTVFAGGVGCMSNVTYWAVVSDRPASCTRAMSVGMTLGGLLATCLSSLQMAGTNTSQPRFAPSLFFAIAATVQFVQLVAFATQVALGTCACCQSWGPSAAESIISFSPADVVEQDEEAVRCGKPKLPVAARLLFWSCFLIYGATYAMPTLQPFIAHAYGSSTERQQLLLAMLVLQNVGDVLGRMSTALIKGSRVVLIAVAWVLATMFLLAVVAACGNQSVGSLISYHTAIFLAPGLCGVYYFCRGFLVTALYLRAREMGERAVVQKISSDMGFWGQMGALGANAVTFLLVNVLRLGA